jgi:SAM-dependent methyltransferase
MSSGGDVAGKVDLTWDDSHVVPEKVTPDLVFLFDRMIEATINKVASKDGDRVLDVGCGRAVDAIKIARKGGRLVGVEPSSVMLNHCKKCVADSGKDVALVQAIGEYLPFKTGSFDWVVCKGALDHFPNPQKSVEEMARITKPDGKVIISIANFESLGHRLGKSGHYIGMFLTRRRPKERQAWETPPDHTIRVTYPVLRKLVSPYLEIEHSMGISFMWGAPNWDSITSAMPKKLAFFILKILDKVAQRCPALSDVILITCRPKKKGSHG